MKFGINTMDDFNFENKTVLCRMDYNQAINKETNELLDTTRIKLSLPTLKELQIKKAKIVLLIHQGSDIEYENFFNTRAHAKVLSDFLNTEVDYIDDVCGPSAREKISNLKPGKILMLDNVRFMSEEQTLFEINLNLSQEDQVKTQVIEKLSPYGDLFLCDAFAAAHRNQPSLCAFQYTMPSLMGRLFEKEYEVLSNLINNPKKPSVFVLGGAKIADAFQIMDTILNNNIADTVLTGGLLANILLLSKNIDIGQRSKEFIFNKGFNKFIEDGKIILEKYPERIILPSDLAFVKNKKRKEHNIDCLDNKYIYGDIGKETIKLYQTYILEAQSVFVNGPLGIFEDNNLELGSKEIWAAISESDAFSIVGGGDSIKATKQFNREHDIDYICTGGGALIRFLSGEELPVVKALRAIK